MTSEKPPTNPPDNDPSNNPEIGPVSANKDERIEAGRFERTASCMDSGVVDSFMEMTERGKEIIGDAYGKLYDVPIVNRAVGKMGIAFKSFWLDRHEKKAAKEKSKMDGFDMATSALEQSGDDLKAVIEDLKQQNMPGREALQLKLKVLERKEAELKNKKDRVQTKFEVQDNQVKRFTNERDAIADKLIGRYEDKLALLENVLDGFQRNRDKIESEFAALDLRAKETEAYINGLEQRKRKREDGLNRAGMRNVKNFPAIVVLNDLMSSRRAAIRIEREALTKRRNAIEKKIIKADNRANSYRDKRDEFVRAKQGRPIDMGVETRSRERDAGADEDISSRSRPEQSGAEEAEAQEANEESIEQPDADNTEGAPKSDESEAVEATGVEAPSVEVQETGGTRPDVSSYVSGWNEYLQNKYGKDNSPELVDMEYLFAKTGLIGEDNMRVEDLKQMLDELYAHDKIPTKSFESDFDDFIKNYAPNK